MIESVALRAPTSPPLIGASSIVVPFSASFFAISRVAVGDIVE